MKLQKGDLIRTITNKDIADELVKKCGYKVIEEDVKPGENKPKESKPEDNKLKANK